MIPLFFSPRVSTRLVWALGTCGEANNPDSTAGHQRLGGARHARYEAVGDEQGDGGAPGHAPAPHPAPPPPATARPRTRTGIQRSNRKGSILAGFEDAGAAGTDA